MDTIAQFYAPVLSAGAILTGFSGSFLQFRIQREASFYSQPNPNYDHELPGSKPEIVLGAARLSLAFLLVISSTLLALVFGFVLPLAALAHVGRDAPPSVVVAGLVASAACLVGYFASELVHYRVVRLLAGRREWQRQASVLVLTLVLVAAGVAWVLKG